MAGLSDQIKKALSLGFEVEIDVWNVDGKWFLGHDEPQYSIDPIFLRNDALWCHAKNLEALHLMTRMGVHCFWHQDDDYTLTSMGWVWAYPGMESPCENSIAVLPEIHNTNTENFWGICSDYIERYK